MKTYQRSFAEKVYQEENDDVDLLMNAFALSSVIKRENRQYWGRELGMCWQHLVCHVFKTYGTDFKPPLRIGQDEPCDMISGSFAIDTKYRVGSGDSGTLKKFRQNGSLLIDLGYKPICLVVRDDNLPAAVAALQSGGWEVLTAERCFDFILEKTGFKLDLYLKLSEGKFEVNR